MIACSIVLTELPRAVRRVSDDAAVLRVVDDVLDRLALFHVDPALLRAAATLPPSKLGSLDALHLAAGLALGGRIESFLVYDHRLADAARAAGLRVEAPGAR